MRNVVLCCVLVVACGTNSDAVIARSPRWAQPVAGSVGNWHVVSPELHRCAQPSREGMRELHAAGVRSVVNLREYHSDVDEAEGSGITLHELRLDAGDLTYAQLCQALRIVLAAEKPCAVHCRRGSDRTGAVVAAWRVAVEGWTPADALEEMVRGGYGHFVLFGNLRRLVGGLDRDRLRADVGLPALR